MEPYDKEAILMDELVKAIDYVTTENNLTYAQIVGILELVKDDYIRQGKQEICEEE